MGRITPSMAKNHIKRSLRAIIDRYPSDSDVDKIWNYFESQCAYCGIKLVRMDRQGHCDHIEGNSNNLHNFALACSKCNGDEKLDSPWLEFLRKKCPDEPEYLKRRDKIKYWMSSANPEEKTQLNAEAEAEIEAAIESYEKSVENLRKLIAKNDSTSNRKDVG